MATINGDSTVNTVNWVAWSFSTQIDFYTDRSVGTLGLHDRITSIANLGVGVTATNPFTNLT